MLMDFRLKNFRSFLAEQTFSFPTGSLRSRQAAQGDSPLPRKKNRASRLAVVFGPNGAGKTNLILALETLRDLVLHSAGYTDAQYAEHFVPFYFGSADVGATEFETEIQLEDARYRYTVCYDEHRVRFERLLVYRTGKPQRWFEREFDVATQEERWAPFSPNFNGSRELWRRMTRPKALFLTTAARLECEQLQPLFRWFERGIGIRYGTEDSDLSGIAASLRDPESKSRILDLLRTLDIPVRDVRVAEGTTAGEDSQAARTWGATHAPERSHVEFLYDQGGEPHWMDSDREAHGTLRLLNLLGPFLNALERGTLLVVDEFDVGLHPLVARFLVQFAKLAPAVHGNPQLLLTSHDVALMVPEILEHEEIWLMERDRDRSSHLLSVADRGPRKRERLVRGYLRGRYGAIPKIELGRLL